MKRDIILKSLVLGFCLLLAVSLDGQDQALLAQTTNPTSPYKSRLTLQSSGENAAMTVHRNAFGMVCLNFEAASRAHIINPDVYDNIVSIKNQCSKPIIVQICYFGSDNCVDVDMLAQQRKDTVLGVRSHSPYFRYSYKEKF